SERVLWEGGPEHGVPRDTKWRLIPALLVTVGAIAALFAGLLALVELPGVTQMGLVAAYFAMTALAVWVAPSFLFDPCRFVITDRRVLWKRGRLRRSIDRYAITYARIAWNPRVPTIGHLELVRAVPFGPLSRKQRLVFPYLPAPDAVLAIVRGAEPSAHAGDATTALTDRLGPGEEVLWGAGPEGLSVDWRHVITTLLGLAVLFVVLPAGLRSAVVLGEL